MAVMLPCNKLSLKVTFLNTALLFYTDKKVAIPSPNVSMTSSI